MLPHERVGRRRPADGRSRPAVARAAAHRASTGTPGNGKTGSAWWPVVAPGSDREAGARRPTPQRYTSVWRTAEGLAPALEASRLQALVVTTGRIEDEASFRQANWTR